MVLGNFKRFPHQKPVRGGGWVGAWYGVGGFEKQVSDRWYRESSQFKPVSEECGRRVRPNFGFGNFHEVPTPEASVRGDVVGVVW